MTYSDFYRLPSVSEALVQHQFPMLWGDDHGQYHFVVDIFRLAAQGPDGALNSVCWLVLKDDPDVTPKWIEVVRQTEKLYRIPKDLTFQEIRLLQALKDQDTILDTNLARHFKDDAQIALLSLVHRRLVIQYTDGFAVSDEGWKYLRANNLTNADAGTDDADDAEPGVDGDFDPDIHESPAPSVETARKTKFEFKTFKGVLPKADGTLPSVGLPSAANDLTPVTIKPRSPLPEGAADDVNPQYVEGVPAHMLMPGDVIYLGADCEVLVDVNVTENSVWLGFKTGNQKVLPKDRLVSRNMRGYHGAGSATVHEQTLEHDNRFEEVTAKDLKPGNVVKTWGQLYEVTTVLIDEGPENKIIAHFENGRTLRTSPDMPYQRLVIK